MGRGAEDALTRRLAYALLAIAAAVGAFLRFDALNEPSYWLDELLGDQLTRSAALQPWWHWLTGIDREHGPLYYATQLWLDGRAVAAVFGVLTIAIVWFASRGGWAYSPPWVGGGASMNTPAAFAAALLLAVSPLHVYYSREARPYALLMLLTAGVVLALLREAPLWSIALLLVAMLYTSAVAAPLVVAIAATALLVRQWKLAAIAAAIAALFLVLYHAEPQPSPGTMFPQLDAAFFASVVRALTVSALGTAERGRTVIALLAFACIGAFAMVKHDRRAGTIVIAMTLFPVVFAVVSLRLVGHWFALRYISPGVIGFVILAGAGMAALAQLVGRRFALVPLIAIVCATVWQTWPNARTEAFRKLDWRGIAAVLRQHVRPGDIILTAEPWSELSLRYYLGEIPGVKLAHMKGVGIAEIMAGGAPAAWLVTAGSSSDASVRNWMCGFPLLLASPLEGFRLHYAPSRRHFLTQRSTLAEQRAVSAALGDHGFTLHLGPSDELLLGDGWANAEGEGRESFRWAVGRGATVDFPRAAPRERVIRLNAYPILQQTMGVSLNGHALATLPMAREWRDYDIPAPARFWREGLNTVTFSFSNATSPGPHDRRELAVSFQTITIVDTGATAEDAEVPSLRLGADRFLDAKTLWRNTPTRFPAAELRREGVEPLLGRLGYDPRTTWPQLARAEIHLDDLAETIAAGSDCEDPASFIHRAFAVLLERHPNDIEEHDLLRRLGSGATREQIIGRIVKSDNFRDMVRRGAGS
jgi:mannosyltransferase